MEKESSPIVFFDTAKRQKIPFSSLEKNLVRMYTCGPTVYSFAHIGNFRTYIFEDVLRRTLEYFGYQVKQVMNITDVDDKTIRGAVKENVSLAEFVTPFIQAFYEDLEALSIQRATSYPSATDYIPYMVAMVEDLMKKKIAYQGGDGSIYFSISHFPSYGNLSHLKTKELKHFASNRVDADEYDKDNVSDFVLWKAYDPERDGNVFWESSFGPGRPGWHLECSCMALHLLGDNIDIHCGGVDNIFPHHENEIAQSEAYSGKPFVRFWLHAEHLIVDGKKMSKSLGNFYTLRDLLEKGYTGKQVRYLLMQTHYKTQLNFTLQGLDAAKESLSRINSFVIRLQGKQAKEEGEMFLPVIKETEKKFSSAMKDDLNISLALASLFDLIREMNIGLDEKKISEKEAKKTLDLLKKMDHILSVISFDQKVDDVPEKIQYLLEKRNRARKEKNWKEADVFRDEIQREGYMIEDTPTGALIKKK